MKDTILVTGAGGFIGHHLVQRLVDRGHRVRAVDLKVPEYERSAAAEFELLDLRRADSCQFVTRGVSEIYHLAADMGGIGYITSLHAPIARNNSLIDLNMLEAARINGVERFLFASSACVYPQRLQNKPDIAALREDDAWPGDPEEGYGLAKLYTEKMCQYYREDHGLDARVARFHNVYGPLGAYDGGREKVPAAICRKVAQAADGDFIEVWGDGWQTRSFLYVDDCVEGIHRLMESGYPLPLNLGSSEMVTINELVDLVMEIADKKLRKSFNLSRPQGVRGRNSDNTRLRHTLGWEPEASLREGLERTYRWIEAQVNRRMAAGRPQAPSLAVSSARS